MQTFNYPIKELFNKGLRPLEESPRNGSYLTAISNGRVTEGGIVGADKYIRTFALNESAQIFSTYKSTFVLTLDTIYSYDGSALTQLLTGIVPGLMWSIADFGEYVLFTNGNVNLIRNITTGAFTVDDGTVFPVARCICAHRGRLILGGPKNYPEVGEDYSNWVAWSDINELNFVSPTELGQARRNLSGYMPMLWGGDILNIMPLNDKIIVYGDNGITAMLLATAEGAPSTYGQVPIPETGILSAEALTTNGEKDEGSIQYFINTVGWLCKIDNNLKVERLGYKEFIN